MPNGRNQDIAVVGSPSSNSELTVDLLQEAIEERLVGALVAFEATQDGSRITSVGPASPLAFSGKPLFFSAFIDPQEFLRANNLPDRQGAR